MWFSRRRDHAENTNGDHMASSATPPVIKTITFDQNSYTPGETITATVAYTPGVSTQTQNFTGTAVDSTTGQEGQLSVTFTADVNDTTTVSVSDTGNRTWTKASDNGSSAVFTAIA